MNCVSSDSRVVAEGVSVSVGAVGLGLGRIRISSIDSGRLAVFLGAGWLDVSVSAGLRRSLGVLELAAPPAVMDFIRWAVASSGLGSWIFGEVLCGRCRLGWFPRGSCMGRKVSVGVRRGSWDCLGSVVSEDAPPLLWRPCRCWSVMSFFPKPEPGFRFQSLGPSPLRACGRGGGVSLW